MKTLKYSIMVLLAITINACNDDAFLTTVRTPEFGWKNLTELEYAAVSPYKEMFYGGWGATHGVLVTNQVMMSDYFRFLGNAEDYSTSQIYNRQMGIRVTEIETLYTKLYTVVGLANNGLTFIHNANDNPFQSTDSFQISEVKRIKGELYFMRAYAYYQLATIFCPPYGYGNDEPILVKRDSVVYNAQSALNNSPVPTSEIYELMISDLKQAKALLPTDWKDGMDVSYKNRARANKWAATAFLAQVYFTMKKFSGTESVLTELDDLIGNGGFTLAVNPFECFNNSSTTITSAYNATTNPGAQEVIFWAYYADTRLSEKESPKIHEVIRYTHFNKCSRVSENGGNGNKSNGNPVNWSNFHIWLQMVMSKNALVEMGWMNADGTEPTAATYDKRYWNDLPNTPSNSSVNDNGLFYRYNGAFKSLAEYQTATGGSATSSRTDASQDGKYIINSKHAGLIGQNEPVVLVNKYYRTKIGYIQNVPVIRLGEIYLNRAMARIKSGTPGWAADYNMVARRAWNATLAGSAYVDKTDGEVNERMILKERWKELAGEDAWYLSFCEACGETIGQGDRAESTSNLVAPYIGKSWKESIPLSEIDFQKK